MTGEILIFNHNESIADNKRIENFGEEITVTEAVYDPITIDDFYKFGAFFADIEEQAVYDARSQWEPILELPTEEHTREIALLEGRKADLSETLETPTRDLAREQRQWERDELHRLSNADERWRIPEPVDTVSANGTTFERLPDGSLLTGGPVPETEIFEISLPVGGAPVTGLRLETLVHESLPGQGLGRGTTNFVLTGFELEVDGEPLRIDKAVADYEQSNFPIANALDLSPGNGWAPNGHNRPGENSEAVFILAEPLEAGPDSVLLVRMHFGSIHTQHIIGRPRLSLTSDPAPSVGEEYSLPLHIRKALQREPSERSDEHREALAAYFRSIAPSLAPTREALAKTEKELAAVRDSIPTMMITVALDEPRVTRVLPRGDWMDESGDLVEPDIPGIFGSVVSNGERATRLDLAEWIASPENPLTARVFINRKWRHFFGTGLSQAVDDFGFQGEWPSHPELLDWLAVEFVNSGWDIKHMVRLMVTSSAYRQSSYANDEMRNRDPANRLLARQSRYRLEAELVRDNALAISGLLAPRIGGPSVFPYQPDGYWSNANTFVGPLIYETSEGEDQYRRGLYTIWKRSFLHPSMMAFDAPAREECTPQRPASNTPLQALVLLNDPSYVEAARVFAEHLIREGGESFESRVAYAFQRAAARAPEAEEIERLRTLFDEHRAAYAADPQSAASLAAVGQAPVPDDIDTADLAAWTSVARVILNLHEVITRA